MLGTKIVRGHSLNGHDTFYQKKCGHFTENLPLLSGIQSPVHFFLFLYKFDSVSFLLQLHFPPFHPLPLRRVCSGGCQRFEALTQSVVLWTLEWGRNRRTAESFSTFWLLINNPLSFKRPSATSPLMHHHLLGLLFEHSTQQCFNRFGCLFSNCSLNTCVWLWMLEKACCGVLLSLQCPSKWKHLWNT